VKVKKALPIRAYGSRGIITSKNANKVHRRSDVLVPTETSAQQVGMDRVNFADTQDKKRELHAERVENYVNDLHVNHVEYIRNA